MKCISCEIEINPQWAHAIDINVCPFCGKCIMEEHLKNLFASLRETMASLQDYSEQLDDWMLSNHNYIKTDSPNIGNYLPAEVLKELRRAEDDREFHKKKDGQKFTVKVKNDNGEEEEVLAEKIQSEERTNAFFKRAEVIRPLSGNQPSSQIGANSPASFQSAAEKTQHIKRVAQQIKKEGAQGTTMNGGSMLLPAEMLEHADPEAVAEFEAMMGGGEIVASSLDSGGDDDDIPAAVLAMAQRGNQRGGGSTNAADLMKLQQMQDRVRRSKEAFENGDTLGSKGGGFSRSG